MTPKERQDLRDVELEKLIEKLAERVAIELLKDPEYCQLLREAVFPNIFPKEAH